MSAAWYGQVHPGVNQRNGPDGLSIFGKIANTGCCPETPKLSFCTTACSMISLLPSGPMWDSAKVLAIESLQHTGDIGFCDTPVCPEPTRCPTLVDYAIYAAMRHVEAVNMILWPAVREINPATAVSTVDDWLNRYGWQDCYKNSCTRSDTPFNYPGECGVSFCEPVYPADYDAALKHAILQSLVRMKKGVIKNLAGLNWVIEPLSVSLRPSQPWPEDVQEYLNGNCTEAPCSCEIAFDLYPSSETLAAAPTQFDAPSQPVSAVQCDVAALPVYPGVIAAECILRSILTKCPSVIRACYYGA